MCVCVCVCVCVCTSPKSLSVSKFPLLIRHQSYCTGGFLGGPMVKNLPAMQEIQVWSLDWEDPLRRTWQPTPIFLPRESHGQRSLVGYRPWGLKESDMTKWLSMHTHKHAYWIEWKWKWSCSVVSDSLRPHGEYRLPGSSVHGIFQARILEWVPIPFSNPISD